MSFEKSVVTTIEKMNYKCCVCGKGKCVIFSLTKIYCSEICKEQNRKDEYFIQLEGGKRK